MLLKSIKLENFRQFRDEFIDFASGEDGKNVTIIIGENGTGKTTFAQAFIWCLYGKVAFKDKVLLNKKVGSKLTPDEEAVVRVELELRHGDVDYKLIRTQKYHKDYSNSIKYDNSVFDIAKKDENGNTNFIPKSQCELEVKNILPEELCSYFFFDGERIEKMSKDISDGVKSSDFAEAVKGLLGLNAMNSAINHFNPRSKQMVIGNYENSFDSSSNSKIASLTKSINEYNDRLSEIEEELENCDNQISSAENLRSVKIEELKQYEESSKLENERESYQKHIDSTKNMKSNVYQNINRDFNSSINGVISLSLIERAIELLNKHDFTGVDIPHMHQDTIKYLINRGVCVCGTHLDQGSLPYNTIMSLNEFLPPEHISTLVAKFKSEARQRTEQVSGFVDSLSANVAAISQQNDDIEKYEEEIRRIDAKLNGKAVGEKINSINEQISIYRKTIEENKRLKSELIFEKGSVTTSRDRADTERQQLTIVDEKNKKTQLYLAYAKAIYKELLEEYKNKEEEIRKKLNKTMDEIFQNIYEGGLYLTIDENYHITVNVVDYSDTGDVETSTAQSISVIFAFITSIIKLAKENKKSSDEDAKLLSSEPYPLVMDAPLSAFDKRRIQTVCEVLPNTAEQVVIFIKDTDGEIAEQHLGDKIGCRHSFNKKNEFETELV